MNPEDRMIALEKQELLEKCLDSLDYDQESFDSKYRTRTCHSRTLNRRKAVLELFLRQKNYTIKELSEILNVSYSQARQIDFRACRALRNVMQLNSITSDDLI
jgi:DNA-directed RNA polymerase sigma subunit (sigma70/sigma32)